MQPSRDATQVADGEETAARHALHLPEILLEIMSQLDSDHETVRAAALVNKAWAEEATNVLWRKPPVSSLASVPIFRRQLYAGKIYDLDFAGDDESVFHESFNTLKFPRLKRINVDAYSPGAGRHLHLEQYIQPSLEFFGFYGNAPADDLLKSLEERCPRLREIALDGPRGRTHPRALAVVLESIREFVNDEILFHLAGRSDLHSLDLPGKISLEDARNINSKVPEPFVLLKRLEVEIQSIAGPEILPSLKSLRELVINVSDNQVNIFPVVSHMTELTRLNVSFGEDMTLSKADMRSLGRLNHLRDLSIEPAVEGEQLLAAFTLTNEDFIDLARKLPALETLGFQVQSHLWVKSLVGLGMKCRHLKRVELPGAFELCKIRAVDRVLFPELTLLELGSATTELENEMDLHSTAQALAEKILQWAPKLRELYCRDGNEFSDEVIAAFKRLTGNEYNS